MIISHTYAQEHLFTILYINVPKLLIEYIDRIRRKRVEEHENDVRERIIHVTSIVVWKLLCNAKVILRTGIFQEPTSTLSGKIGILRSSNIIGCMFWELYL